MPAVSAGSCPVYWGWKGLQAFQCAARSSLMSKTKFRRPPSTATRFASTCSPIHHDLWYWLIPFSDGRCSIGVVGGLEAASCPLSGYGHRPVARVGRGRSFAGRLLAQARWDTPVRQLVGYARNVSSLWGRGYALLGNAGEFLDPIFSSGVTIAFKSASLAARWCRASSPALRSTGSGNLSYPSSKASTPFAPSSNPGTAAACSELFSIRCRAPASAA